MQVLSSRSDVANEEPAGPRQSEYLSWLPFAAAIAYCVGNVLFVSHIGNFPVNDDMFYALPVKNLLETGELRFTSLVASCYLPVLTGAAACKLFGFSYETLRMVTLTAGLLGVWGIFLAVRETGMSRSLAGLFSLVYAVNPLIVNLSFTFMTDIMFLTLVNFYLYFTLRGIRRDSFSCLAAGALFLIASLACRQISVLFVLANVVFLFNIWLQGRRNLLLAGMLAGAPILATVALNKLTTDSLTHSIFLEFYKKELWLKLTGLLSEPTAAITDNVLILGQSWFYLGLFCLPLMFGTGAAVFSRAKQDPRQAFLPVFLSVGSTGFILARAFTAGGPVMPFSQNILKINDLGIDSIIGMSTWFPARWHEEAVTVIAGIAACFLLAVTGMAVVFRLEMLLNKPQRKFDLNSTESSARSADSRELTLALFAFSGLLVMLGFLVLQLQVLNIDRYYLAVLPPLLIVLSIAWRWFDIRPCWTLACLAALMIGTSASVAQQHYMSWNRARWLAIEVLLASGVASRSLDGGHEYLHYKGIDAVGFPDFKRHRIVYPPGSFGRAPLDRFRWWHVRGDEYVVSHWNIPGRTQDAYRAYLRFPYWSALLNRTAHIYVLKRIPDVSPAGNYQELP